jgi:hypothetical protein
MVRKTMPQLKSSSYDQVTFLGTQVHNPLDGRAIR